MFYRLVHNTSIASSPEDAVSINFKAVFGNHPNKKNLREFLRMDAIQYLWFGVLDGKVLRQGFRQSHELQRFMQGFSESNKKLIYQFCESIEPAGLPVLP